MQEQFFLQIRIKFAELLQDHRQTRQQIICDQPRIPRAGQAVRMIFSGETVEMDPDLRGGERIIFLRQKRPGDPGQDIAASGSGEGWGPGEIERLSAVTAVEDPGVRTFLDDNGFCVFCKPSRSQNPTTITPSVLKRTPKGIPPAISFFPS